MLLLPFFFHLFYFSPPFSVVLHLKPLPWLILLSLPSYLSPACRLSSASLPSFLLFCPADCATRPASKVGGMVRTLNLLMQPFVVIASELAAPLPGSADRYSGTLPQLPAIGYLLLFALSVHICVCLCVTCGHHKYGKKKNKDVQIWMCVTLCSLKLCDRFVHKDIICFAEQNT